MNGFPVSRRSALLQMAGIAAIAHGAEPPPRVVASFSLLADLARELLPSGARIHALVGPDADAHVYEPRPADARRLAEADLVVVNGLGFEGWIDRLVAASGHRGRVAVASSDIRPRRVGPAPDPHAWQDVSMARRYAQTLAAAFVERWPAQAATIRSRAASYGDRLAALDAQVRRWLDGIPRERRRVITSHDAFGYFGEAYGVDFQAPQGWSSHAEPSAAAVARLIQQIRRQQVTALFVENISDPRLLERIARESGVRVGGRLYSDALSGPGGPASTYVDLVAHNARSLASAMGG